jgi:hypothetical protein
MVGLRHHPAIRTGDESWFSEEQLRHSHVSRDRWTFESECAEARSSYTTSMGVTEKEHPEGLTVPAEVKGTAREWCILLP